ncbi:hypothetical protein NQ176_g1073 [Zarea fungicola]|uniref:Uncharacterized protein n=1 Tax=Zarea fungicola TaxID=93591 RepID=A0ACC1NUW0_9HYPO|nr:hypothetical protein NQ176_g1073 [Lecanicillium fungicola]
MSNTVQFRTAPQSGPATVRQTDRRMHRTLSSSANTPLPDPVSNPNVMAAIRQHQQFIAQQQRQATMAQQAMGANGMGVNGMGANSTAVSIQLSPHQIERLRRANRQTSLHHQAQVAALMAQQHALQQQRLMQQQQHQQQAPATIPNANVAANLRRAGGIRRETVEKRPLHNLLQKHRSHRFEGNMNRGSTPRASMRHPHLRKNHTISEDFSDDTQLHKRRLIAVAGSCIEKDPEKSHASRTPQIQSIMDSMDSMDIELNQPSSQQAQEAQMKQMQSQQGGLSSAMDQDHSPAINAGANRRGPNGMKPMGPQPGQPTAPFGDQRFNPAMQRPNQGLLQAMLAGVSPEQRRQIINFSPEKLTELVRRWGLQQQQQARINAGQINPT